MTFADDNDDGLEIETMRLATKFCPRCGANWAPLADYVAKPFRPGTCIKCRVSVEPTWLSMLIVATLVIVGIGSCTAFCYRPPSVVADAIGCVASWLLLLLPFVQGGRQFWARRRFKKTGEPPADVAVADGNPKA